jgi:phospholipase/carboxylesterase
MARNRYQRSVERAASLGILQARPGPSQVRAEEAPRGLQPLGLDDRRDGMLYVPAGYRSDLPAPLALLLHGAGGSADQGIQLLQPLADAAGLIVLAPQSRRQTWDVLVREYGPDVAFIDRALARTFARYTVDAARVAVGDFSDGASYALSLGLINGDLFTHVIAFSPGFMAPTRQEGAPCIFISHGTHDTVLAIVMCSRRIVPQLEQAGYDLVYREFEGGHTVPGQIAREALGWFTGG